MNNINELLIAGRNLAEMFYKNGNNELGLAVLQLTSQIALPQLPESHKVICRCGKQLANGIEVKFYNHVGMCMTCDSVYSDCLTEAMYE